MNNVLHVGVDVGSTTAKVAVLDPDDKLVYSRYERHNAKVKELVGSYLREIDQKFPGARVAICVTGSVGMSTAEQKSSLDGGRPSQRSRQRRLLPTWL